MATDYVDSMARAFTKVPNGITVPSKVKKTKSTAILAWEELSDALFFDNLPVGNLNRLLNDQNETS
jgi:hypothetical protein